MDKKDLMKAFLTGCFSMGLVPSSIKIPDVPDVPEVSLLDSKPVWEGVADCFNEAGVLMENSARRLVNA